MSFARPKKSETKKIKRMESNQKTKVMKPSASSTILIKKITLKINRNDRAKSSERTNKNRMIEHLQVVEKELDDVFPKFKEFNEKYNQVLVKN